MKGLGSALVVAGAGAAGCVARWAVGLALPGGRLPWATLVVNVVGSLAMGVVVAALVARGLGDSRARDALVVGFLGGFTTYSSFAFETVAYVERRQVGSAGLYIGVTLVACALACAAGLAVGRRLWA